MSIFKRLRELAVLPGPKFVFAHIISPHPPYLFDRKGNLPPLSEMGTLSIGDNDIWKSPRYIDQLVFINRQVEDVVDRIVSNSKVPPIIIIQGDHGPGCFTLPTLNGPARSLTMEEVSQQCIRSRMGIFNAYYFPGVGKSMLYSTITPVNSFRVVFDAYLGTKLGLLEDKSYVHSCGEKCELYQFRSDGPRHLNSSSLVLK